MMDILSYHSLFLYFSRLNLKNLNLKGNFAITFQFAITLQITLQFEKFCSYILQRGYIGTCYLCLLAVLFIYQCSEDRKKSTIFS